MTVPYTTEEIVEQLGELIRDERILEKLLERASRAPEDPREVAYLWNLATECRDHARILSRHRRELNRRVEEIPYPRWPRGQGPQPDEALDRAQYVAAELADAYRTSELVADDPYLRKFLIILGEEHERRAIEIKGIASGIGIFDDVEEAPETSEDD
jgi:hypothetical protein